MIRKKYNLYLLGALIMISTEIFASGCTSKSQKKDNQPQAEAPAQEAPKPYVNEDGITIFPPTDIMNGNGDYEYGETVNASYYSTTAEKKKKVCILLPPNYTTEKKYPVLYILHGIFGDERSMVGGSSSGNRYTVWNMMNTGDLKECIVVFPYMYTSKTQDQCTAIDEQNVAAYDIFVEDLANDLMPWLAQNYSVAEGRENTAIIGFSMGGREALAIGILRSDLFGYVGAIAPAPGLIPGKDFAMFHKGQFEEDQLKFRIGQEPNVLMICAGDCDSVVGTFPITYHAVFKNNGVDHIWWIIPGSDHGDPAITSGIYNFCQRIFK